MGAATGSHHNYSTVAADTLSGGASGALAGASIGAAGGPIGIGAGALIGGAAGFLTGLFTGDSPDPIAPPSPPPPTPDLADELGQRADIAKRMRLMASGSGSFLTGPLGDQSGTGSRAPSLGGL